jgi:hypothetical protein
MVAEPAECPECAAKDAEIERLRADVTMLRNQSVTIPVTNVTKSVTTTGGVTSVTKRNRAAYMAQYRAKKADERSPKA